MRIIVLPHPHRVEACEVGKRILEYAFSRSIEGKLYEDWPKQISGDFDVGVVIGGDGTLLRASKLLSPLGVPILGIKVGGLGFLLDVAPEDYRIAIDKLLHKDYYVESRGTLEVIVESESMTKGKFLAINDAVVNKGTFARMLEITLFVNNKLVARYPADGIIVSTPTGSTAYSLSAGGPIVSPNLDCILVTPICPHSLFLRPLLLNPKDIIEIVVGEKHEEVMLTIDGQLGLHLDTKDKVRVSFSDIQCKLIRLSEDSDFFTTLREKLHWGEGIGDA
ncbi:MAG: NAD(+)/NADH kinase [bacterium]